MRIKILQTNAICKSDFKLRSFCPYHGHLFVRFKTHTEVLTKNGYEYAKPGDFIFYNRNEMIEYNSVDTQFKHDYFRFFLEEDEEHLFSIPTSVLYSYQMSEKLENIFSLLVTEYFSSSESRDNSINLLGILFLINAHEYVKHRSSSSTLPHYEALDKLRSQILNSPQNQYKISELAQSIHMSPSYFQNCYKKAFGTSCINDIINARIKKATYLLTSTDKTEAEIAELCGYNSNEHFIRQFKSYKGKTPSQFRKTIKL